VTEVQRRASYAGAFIAIVGLGLLCRSPALGLPWLVAKYAGSMLWGAMIYAGLRTIAPRACVSSSGATACAISVCVELSRLYRQPELDAFRVTLAGKLLLGSIFSPWNMVAYAAGVVIAALMDQTVAPRARIDPPEDLLARARERLLKDPNTHSMRRSPTRDDGFFY